jgi:acetyl-CoA carboxylase biotin carboxylase subunit
MFEKILIANRGEIALRIIRACKEMGIKSVAVYSEADADSLHVRFADEEVCIGPPQSAQSYLDIRRIISAAEVTNCDAIHPGYGFLAENADFAEICNSCGLVFIGPSPESMRLMGDKATAKKMMHEAGVPVVPGSQGVIDDLKDAEGIAEEIGYPVIIKATAGGGGKGMRVVEEPDALKKAFSTARMEAGASFNNSAVYMEKYVTQPRHVEIQILADQIGNVVHLGERDCTIQRRHQKLIEESPSPALTEDIRRQMGKAAILGARAAKYHNAGTIEFLLDEDGSFYFMEMNTRIQVEHPVTEEATDVDLIREQLLIAGGDNMTLKQEEIRINGHTIECRINAEDPAFDFRPAPGQITSFHTPGGHGVRVDTHAYAKYVIPQYYDSMIAKLITHAKTRDGAIMKMRRALEEFIIEGIPTTIPFQRAVIDDPVFQSGKYSTKYIEGFNWDKNKYV